MKITRERILEKVFERVGEAFDFYTEDDFRDYVAGVHDIASSLLMELAREEKNDSTVHS